MTARLIAIGTIVLLLAMGWVALLNLRAIADSSLRGEVFSMQNATRFKRLGWTVLAYPVVLHSSAWLFGAVVSAEAIGVPGFTLDLDRSDGAHWFVMGLLLLSVSWAFRWGVELRRFEAETI